MAADIAGATAVPTRQSSSIPARCTTKRRRWQSLGERPYRRWRIGDPPAAATGGYAEEFVLRRGIAAPPAHNRARNDPVHHQCDTPKLPGPNLRPRRWSTRGSTSAALSSPWCVAKLGDGALGCGLGTEERHRSYRRRVRVWLRSACGNRARAELSATADSVSARKLLCGSALRLIHKRRRNRRTSACGVRATRASHRGFAADSAHSAPRSSYVSWGRRRRR